MRVGLSHFYFTCRASGQLASGPLGYMERTSSSGHEASPQSGLGVGCRRCPNSKELCGLNVRVEARRLSTSISFPVARVTSFLSLPAQRDKARRVEVQCRVPERGDYASYPHRLSLYREGAAFTSPRQHGIFSVLWKSLQGKRARDL